jgi:hypothetical protein
MPSSFKIMGQRYAVKTYAHIADEAGEALNGDIDHDFHVVRMAEHQADVEKQETLLHEVLHGVFRKAGFKTENDEHEDVVNRLSPILLQFLKENPAVYTFLTGRYTYR